MTASRNSLCQCIASAHFLARLLFILQLCLIWLNRLAIVYHTKSTFRKEIIFAKAKFSAFLLDFLYNIW